MTDKCDCIKVETQRFKDLHYELNDGSEYYITIYVENCPDCGRVVRIYQND